MDLLSTAGLGWLQMLRWAWFLLVLTFVCGLCVSLDIYIYIYIHGILSFFSVCREGDDGLFTVVKLDDFSPLSGRLEADGTTGGYVLSASANGKGFVFILDKNNECLSFP